MFRGRGRGRAVKKGRGRKPKAPRKPAVLKVIGNVVKKEGPGVYSAVVDDTLSSAPGFHSYRGGDYNYDTPERAEAARDMADKAQREQLGLIEKSETEESETETQTQTETQSESVQPAEPEPQTEDESSTSEEEHVDGPTKEDLESLAKFDTEAQERREVPASQRRVQQGILELILVEPHHIYVGPGRHQTHDSR